jgi:hypothetical protein
VLADRPPAEVGWGLLVQLRVVHTVFGDDTAPLVHRRGRYVTVAPEQPSGR